MSNRLQRRQAQSESRKRKSWDWQELPIITAAGPLRRIRRAVRNDFWIVQFYDVMTELGPVVHLMIRSVAGAFGYDGHGVEPSWRELQRIKDELCGPDAEAVQCYPRAADVTDEADMYHLFVLPPGWPLPFGLHRECGFARTP
jgi:hypothetical protein